MKNLIIVLCLVFSLPLFSQDIDSLEYSMFIDLENKFNTNEIISYTDTSDGKIYFYSTFDSNTISSTIDTFSSTNRCVIFSEKIEYIKSEFIFLEKENVLLIKQHNENNYTHYNMIFLSCSGHPNDYSKSYYIDDYGAATIFYNQDKIMSIRFVPSIVGAFVYDYYI